MRINVLNNKTISFEISNVLENKVIFLQNKITCRVMKYD